jgi:hypothetical protein
MRSLLWLALATLILLSIFTLIYWSVKGYVA